MDQWSSVEHRANSTQNDKMLGDLSDMLISVRDHTSWAEVNSRAVPMMRMCYLYSDVYACIALLHVIC